MPFLALRGGERVLPPQVEDDETIYCRLCDEELSIVDSYPRKGGVFVARHFRHHGQGGGATGDGGGRTEECPGESDAHLRMKSIAYSRLEHDFPNASVELEGAVGKHRADVLLAFESPRPPYGEGIAVEVQYRNIGKNVDAVEQYYLENGYSVVWLHEYDFSGRDVDLSGMRTVWPYAVPIVEGTAGYPDVTRWLWQEKSPSVELEVSFPEAFWEAHRQGDDDWVPVVKSEVRRRGRAWAQVSLSPTREFVLELSKTGRTYGSDVESVKVQLSESDVGTIRRFVETIEETGFSRDSPTRRGTGEWEEIDIAWLAGGLNTTAWLKAAFSASGEVVLTLGKKAGRDSETVHVQVDQTMTTALSEVVELTRTAFEIERSRQ
jgi:hypothetical protein